MGIRNFQENLLFFVVMLPVIALTVVVLYAIVVLIVQDGEHTKRGF